jgi:hypothetical protein
MAGLTIGLCVTGCIAIPARDTLTVAPGSAHTTTGEVPTAQEAASMIFVSKSTCADVAARLGTAIVIPFDSGYQIWVYRWPGLEMRNRNATELVVLCNPSGVAMKARVRPSYETAK